jgi:hypothetical protein
MFPALDFNTSLCTDSSTTRSLQGSWVNPLRISAGPPPKKSQHLNSSLSNPSSLQRSTSFSSRVNLPIVGECQSNMTTPSRTDLYCRWHKILHGSTGERTSELFMTRDALYCFVRLNMMSLGKLLARGHIVDISYCASFAIVSATIWSVTVPNRELETCETPNLSTLECTFTQGAGALVPAARHSPKDLHLCLGNM